MPTACNDPHTRWQSGPRGPERRQSTARKQLREDDLAEQAAKEGDFEGVKVGG
jgi:hypothetical protein